MALAALNLSPTDRQLRQFAAAVTVLAPLAAWFWNSTPQTLTWVALIGGVIGGAGLIVPRLIKPLFVGLTIITFPLGLIAGELAMLLIFSMAFLPLAIVFRFIGRDSLNRRSAASSGETKSYWQARSKPSKVSSYYQQF